MSTKADYSAEEWRLFLKGPLMVGLAVVAASPSGPLGVLREMLAVGKLVAETRAQPGASELLRTLVSELSAPDARGQVDAAEVRGLASEQLRAHAIGACRTLAALIDRKATPAEAGELKQWLVGIAQRTARAAKEGGFLGFGGVKVSESETTAIRDVARALGATSPV